MNQLASSVSLCKQRSQIKSHLAKGDEGWKKGELVKNEKKEEGRGSKVRAGRKWEKRRKKEKKRRRRKKMEGKAKRVPEGFQNPLVTVMVLPDVVC